MPAPDDANALAPRVFALWIEAMTDVLSLGEMVMGGKDSREFTRFKAMVMRIYYAGSRETLDLLVRQGLAEACGCGADGRRKTECEHCGGSGQRDRAHVAPKPVNGGPSAG